MRSAEQSVQYKFTLMDSHKSFYRNVYFFAIQGKQEEKKIVRSVPRSFRFLDIVECDRYLWFSRGTPVALFCCWGCRQKNGYK